MNGIQTIQAALRSTANLPAWYLSDLSDGDLLVRPAPNANHIAWQIGHLISGEQELLKVIMPDAKMPELPAGFSKNYTKETATRDTGFLTKKEYLDLFGKMREALITIVGTLSDADLDKPVNGPMAKMAPNWGSFLILMSNHILMHAGQFTVVRRKLGKPVLF